jgi:hypothetical protein
LSAVLKTTINQRRGAFDTRKPSMMGMRQDANFAQT